METSDGTRREFSPGEVMFQDNVENSPAAKQPQHKSGAHQELPTILSFGFEEAEGTGLTKWTMCPHILTRVAETPQAGGRY